MHRGTPIIFALAGICSLGVFVASLSGLAVSGPDQSFTISQGGTKTSYIRIWNEGTEAAEISVQAGGSAADIMTINDPSLQLGPGESAVVDLIYSIPGNHPTGLCEGYVEAMTTGGTVGTSVLRPVSIWVTSGGSDQVTLSLNAGLNLVSWSGDDMPLGDALGSGQDIDRVWMRTDSGHYVFASWYDGQGWWSADSEFTGLKRGGAYFVECSSSCVVELTRAGGTHVLELKSGTNLVGWTGETLPVDEALPQSPSYHPVSKVWRRNADGSYSAVQYFPEEGIWWSADASFDSLELGRAYFVECDQDATFTIPG